MNARMLGAIVVSAVFLPAVLSCPGKTDVRTAATYPQPSGTVVQTPIDYPLPTRAPTKFALLVGIDRYKYPTAVSALNGCVNDVEDMKNLLIGKYEFPESNVLVLRNEAATHEGIVNAFREHLIRKAQRDDIIVFHYSGHGSQMKDVSGDETDSLDETLVPYDSRDPQGKVFDINDDELNWLLDSLAHHTRYITILLDACHSGTAVRASGLVRQAPIDQRIPPPQAAYAPTTRNVDGASGVRSADLPYVLLAACLSKQSAYEHWAEGKAHGALTYFLTRELRRSTAAATYRDVLDIVKGEIMSFYPNEEAQLEGSLLDHYVFSDSSGLVQPYVTVSGQRGNIVSLDGGTVTGMTVGSVYDIFRPGTKKFDNAGTSIGTVELTKVEMFTSEGRLLAGAQIPQYSRATERQHNFADRTLVVFYQNLSQSSQLRTVKALLDTCKFIQTTPQPHGYHLLLRESGGKIVTEGPDTTVISPEVAIGDPNAALKVVDQVKQWAKWYNLLSLENSSSSAGILFTLNAVKGSQSRDPFARIDSTTAVLTDKEGFECRVENRSARDLYVSILDLSSDGSVTVIFPYETGSSELLPKGKSVVKQFDTFVPDGKVRVVDVIKVFATSAPVDFHVLALPALRLGTKGDALQSLRNPLGELLAQAALNLPRGSRPSGIRVDEWTTSQKAITVVKAPQ